jgi:hypothetical protein
VENLYASACLASISFSCASDFVSVTVVEVWGASVSSVTVVVTVVVFFDRLGSFSNPELSDESSGSRVVVTVVTLSLPSSSVKVVTATIFLASAFELSFPAPAETVLSGAAVATPSFFSTSGIYENY